MATKKARTRKTTTMDTRPQDISSVPDTADTAEGRQPHEINSALDSPRMKALLRDHQKMGARPK